jgi:hypothetical protein
MATCPAARLAMTVGMKYGLTFCGPFSWSVSECW